MNELFPIPEDELPVSAVSGRSRRWPFPFAAPHSGAGAQGVPFLLLLVWGLTVALVSSPPPLPSALLQPTTKASLVV